MLKALGAGLVLGAAVIYGYQLKIRLWEHVRQLVGLKEMLLMLSGEISYTRTPLQEAFRHIAGQGKEPYGTFLFHVAEIMEDTNGKPLSELWSEELFKQEKEFLLTVEEMAILEGIGENLGYLDVNMQMGSIELHIQQIETRIVQAQQELAAKQKMYQYLSVMCGLFLILILI